MNLTGDFNTGMTELQRGRNLLRGWRNWGLYQQLSCALAEINFQVGQYEVTVEICQHILSIWTPTAHSLVFFKLFSTSFTLIANLSKTHSY